MNPNEIPLIDLHVHTSFSDGQYTPEEVLKRAEKKSLYALSFTDHDTIEAYKTKYQTKITIIPGIELSSEFNGYSIHILGYAFNPQDETICTFLEEVLRRRAERNQKIVQKLFQAGFSICEEDLILRSKGTYGRNHIAQYLLEKGVVRSSQEAFTKYIGEGKPYYVAGEKFAPQDVIDAIHKAKGFAVLAHPHLIFSKSIAEHILELNFDGIECYYGNQSIVENQKWEKIAKQNDLFVTGGSDFHGEVIRPQVDLGCATTPLQTFQYMYDRCIKNTL